MRLSEEVEGARRRLTDSLNLENENHTRVVTISQEVERLNNVLRNKM